MTPASALIEPEVASRVLTRALRTGGDFAELFAEDRSSSSARLDDTKVEELTSGRERGVGIRVVKGATTGFAHTSDLREAGLIKAAEAAGAAARDAGANTSAATINVDSTLGAEERRGFDRLADPAGDTRNAIGYDQSGRVMPHDVTKSRKADLLLAADDAARSESAAISQVAVSYGDLRRRILVTNSEGLWASDDQVRTRFFVSCTAADRDGRQTGYEAPGRTMGFELFDHVDVAEVARTAARRAVRMLRARPAPSGTLAVVLRRGAGGVLFHEACGHGLEADLVGRDASVFRDRVGQAVASPLITLVDDGGYEREWGTYSVDDEGRPAQRTTLIENGELSDYMWDGTRARKADRLSSGNGRRQSYQHLPMVRMTNTYVTAGADDPDEIIRQTKYGVYCVQLGGGQVNTTTGDFVFGITEAYLIENGQITAPVRAANLIGNGPEVLKAIDAVGNDFETWTGTCGKDGQSVAVSAGQPTLRVSAMTIGGTGG